MRRMAPVRWPTVRMTMAACPERRGSRETPIYRTSMSAPGLVKTVMNSKTPLVP